MEKITIGQCWASTTEPELGLGFIHSIEARSIGIHYPSKDIIRRYTANSAPVKRMLFQVGDTVTAQDGRQLRIALIKNIEGLVAYLGDDTCIIESDLAPQNEFNAPQDKLLAGQVDKLFNYKIRQKTLELQHSIQTSPVAGLIGPRVSLLAHQFYIADQVSKRPFPRVLLADEVGLGKTIEAGLILHQMLLSGQAHNTLIVVPDALCNQWFVEMYRKFNLSFNVLNKETAIQDNENPFADSNLHILSMDLLCNDEHLFAQALNINWDLVLVDEAHRMQWTNKTVSKEYQTISELSKMTNGLILLTATPEQLGLEGHFSRLKLLDPERFSSFKEFEKESQNYTKASACVDLILNFENLDKNQKTGLKKSLASFFPGIDISSLSSAHKRNILIEKFIDLHGSGRIVFRNSRQSLADNGLRFTKRIPFTYPLEKTSNTETSKLNWLLDFLKSNKEEKSLLICHSLETLKKIHTFIKKHPSIKCSVFHEKCSLLERDRNAAYFSEDNGAQILLCSEIGSEGRNFQFAHHLILFDLPKNADTLEQRIGRLDRIGQSKDINIHIPFLKNTEEDIWLQCYQDAFNAFSSIPKGAQMTLKEHQSKLEELCQNPLNKETQKKLTNLIQSIKSAYTAKLNTIEHSKDRLLELNSCRMFEANSIIDHIIDQESSDFLENFLLTVFEVIGIEEEELSEDIYFIKPGPTMVQRNLPSLNEDGLSITFNRNLALKKQNISFISFDHPLVAGILDLILGQNFGSVTVSTWDTPPKDTAPIVEAFYALDLVADKKLNASQYFPSELLRVVLGPKGEDLTTDWPSTVLKTSITEAHEQHIKQATAISRRQLDGLLGLCKTNLEDKKEALLETLRSNMQNTLDLEIQRLETLQKSNPLIKNEEIDFFKHKKETLTELSQNVKLRLDCFQLIMP